MCLKEIQSSNKFTVCGGNQIPDLLGKHRLSELELRYTEPAERMQGRTPASHWREEQIRVPRGEAWILLWVGARGSLQRTRLCSIAVGLVMCSAAGGLHACRRWRHGPRYEGLHWRKSLVFILSKKPREPLMILFINYLQGVPARRAAQPQDSPSSGIVSVILCRITNYSKLDILKPQTFISSQFLWVRNAGRVTWLPLAQGCNLVGTEGKVLQSGWRMCPQPHSCGLSVWVEWLPPEGITQGRVRPTPGEGHPRQGDIFLKAVLRSNILPSWRSREDNGASFNHMHNSRDILCALTRTQAW